MRLWLECAKRYKNYDHTCFFSLITLTLAESLWRCLNTWTISFIFIQLPRNLENVNVWKMCVISVVSVIFFWRHFVVIYIWGKFDICEENIMEMSRSLARVRTGLKSTWIYRTVLKSPWKLNLPWKVLEKHSSLEKSLNFTIQHCLLRPKSVWNCGAYAAPNKGTTISY